jgi:poly-gamma-glutamate synthesis protein (capsule biosynthesis protein)
VWDAGAPGIEDHIAELEKYGIVHTGAGMTLDEARRPAIVERKGTRIGFLSYNCVGPKSSWARADKPGCSYVQILTHVELPEFGPQVTYTFAEPESLNAMVSNIEALRSACDVLVVALHKGVLHVPAEIAMYDRQVSYAAIDAGADLVVGHHAHVLKGIEFYRGKAIFHGLNNFVTVTLCLWPEHAPTLKLKAHALKRQKYFKPDPEYAVYPFHPEARKTIIAKCIVEEGRITRLSYLPCLINKSGQPEALKHDERGQEVFDYMEKITREPGLNARYAWAGDEVMVLE